MESNLFEWIAIKLLLYYLLWEQKIFAMNKLENLCRYHNNLIEIIQIIEFDRITSISLCSDRNETIKLDSKILAYEIDIIQQDLLFITAQRKLYRKNLRESNQKPRLLAEYFPLDITRLALDWINHLLYMVVDQSEIVLTSTRPNDRFAFKKTSLLFSIDSGTIKKLLVCPGLSLLIWHEIEWNENNRNRIKVCQQDGTMIRTLHSSQNFIYDLNIDHFDFALFFISGGNLGRISLNSLGERTNLGVIEKEESYFRLTHNVLRNFALLDSDIIVDIKYNLIFAYRLNYLESKLDDTPKRSKLLTDLNKSNLRLSSDREFRIYSSRMFSETFQTICHDQLCIDVCVPNGNQFKFSCLCYTGNERRCNDYGHYSDDKRLSYYNTRSTSKDHQNYSKSSTVDEQVNFSHSVFWNDSRTSKSNPFQTNKSVQINLTQIESPKLTLELPASNESFGSLTHSDRDISIPNSTISAKIELKAKHFEEGVSLDSVRITMMGKLELFSKIKSPLWFLMFAVTTFMMTTSLFCCILGFKKIFKRNFHKNSDSFSKNQINTDSVVAEKHGTVVVYHKDVALAATDIKEEFEFEKTQLLANRFGNVKDSPYENLDSTIRYNNDNPNVYINLKC
ncbi:hypothetical protein SSS_00084 [Sarcoptes scabiei]|uniref:Uncharacterized protein n=1 Tax=Sarcoptes scabiei TaxID=52283 RepID=A0A834VFA0_SARSC|nr:hypothetical protein SSS_00084 [Sarcoptes scabiei]